MTEHAEGTLPSYLALLNRIAIILPLSLYLTTLNLLPLFGWSRRAFRESY
jgi:hypothetical protein